MRTIYSIPLAVLATVVGLVVEDVHASSIDIVWQDSGALAVGTSATADVIITIGAGDTAWGGAGAVIDIDLNYTGVSYLSRSENISGLGGIIHGVPVDDGLGHVEDFIAAGDLFGFVSPLLPGSVTVIGSVTVVLDSTPVSLVAGAPDVSGDGIHANALGSILSEFSFGAATYAPEPGSASLLGLGLVGLATARRRKARGSTGRFREAS